MNYHVPIGTEVVRWLRAHDPAGAPMGSTVRTTVPVTYDDTDRIGWDYTEWYLFKLPDGVSNWCRIAVRKKYVQVTDDDADTAPIPDIYGNHD